MQSAEHRLAVKQSTRTESLISTSDQQTCSSLRFVCFISILLVTMRSVIVRLNEFYLVDVSGLRVKLAVNVHAELLTSFRNK